MQNLVAGLSVSIQLHVDGSSRMTSIRLHVIDIETEFLHAAERLDAERILAHSARHNALIPHERRDVRKICRSPAQARSARQQFPKHCPQTQDSLLHARNR